MSFGLLESETVQSSYNLNNNNKLLVSIFSNTIF